MATTSSTSPMLLLISLAISLTVSLVNAQQITSVSTSTVPVSGGASLTLYGVAFPVSEPTWVVFLTTRYDLTPAATCLVDTFKSTANRAVCTALSPFPVAAAGNVSLYQPSTTYYAGLKTTSSTEKYFFTTASVTVTTTAVGPLLFSAPSILSTASSAQTVYVQLGGNITSDALYSANAGKVSLTIRSSATSSASTCSLLPSTSLSSSQLAGLASATPTVPFSCPSGVPTGFYSITVNIGGRSASVFKSYVNHVIRYDSSLGEYSTFVPPVVASVTPSTVSAATNITFTIAGTGFGTSVSDNTVTIGGAACNVLSSTSTQVVCRGLPGTTTPAALVEGGTGVLRRFFDLSQAITSTVPLSVLTASIPTGDLASAATNLGMDVVVTDLDFPAGTFAASGISAPFAAVHEGFFTPTVSGSYQFYCVGSDSAVFQVYASGSWSTLCSAESSFAQFPMQFVGQASAVSAARVLTAATAIKFRVAFGISNLSTSFATFSMSLAPSSATFAAATPKVAVPHMVAIVATKTSGTTSSFDIAIGTLNAVHVHVPAASDCSSLPSVQQAIRSASSGQFGALATLVETASSCTWYVAVVGDATAQAAVAIVSNTTSVSVVLQGSSQWFWNAIPAYLATVSHDLSSLATQGVVAVTSRGIKAFHARTTGVVAPFLVATTLPPPNACTVSPLELATVSLQVNITSSAFLVANPTADFVSYNGLYSSLDNALTMNTSTIYSVVAPSTLPSSVYAVYLNQGEYGRILCGSVVQGFQAILISPTSGTRYGGTRLTITGSNFPTNFAGFSIYIGGAPCNPYYATTTSIQCRTTTMLATPTEVPVSTATTATTFFVRMYANQTNLPSELQASYLSYAPFGGSLAPRFSYSLTGVPFISSISPTSGGGGTRNTVTINGAALTGVSFSLCDTNLTSCSPIVCPTTTVTATQAICTTPRLPAAVYIVVGRTTAIGRTNINITYSSILFVNSTSPLFLSPTGGSVVTITGAGFGDGVSVSIGSSSCVVTSVNTTTILCTTSGAIIGSSAIPVVHLPTIADRSASVPNSTGVEIQTTFPDSASTPTVPYFYPQSGNGVGTTITIAAQNFPSAMADPSLVTVMLGVTPCATFSVDASNSPALIYCNRTQSAPAGADPMKVWLGDYGLLDAGAASTDVPFVATTYTHTLTVDSISPLTGSTAGGILVTVEGLGFGTSNFSVTMGTVACNTGSAYAGTSVAVDRVVCMTSAASALTTNTTEFIYIQSREVISIFGSKFNFLTTQTPLLTKASPLTGNAGTVISLSVDNVGDASNVKALLLVGVEVNVTYVPLDSSFSVTLPSLPAFRSPLQMKATNGYSRSASSIVFVSYPSISTITPQQANSAGGTLITIQGQRFGRPGFADNLKVIICGNPCTLVSYSLTNITCVAPPLQNLNTISATTASIVVPYTATYTGTSSTAATLVMDSDITTGTVVTRSSSGLQIDVNLGDYQSAHILKVSFFPTAGYEASLVGGTIQSSSDGATWTVLSTIVSVAAEWNTVSYQAKTLYTQYIRFAPPATASSFGLQEVQIFGLRGASTAVSYCPLIVTMTPPGSDLMSTCLQQPLLCINVDTSIRVTFTTTYSPAITRIQPEAATTRGGSTINLYGSFPTVSTTDITVVAGGMPCTVSSAGTAQISCVTSAAYIDTAPSQVTSLSIVGFGVASLSTPPFYLSESWSSADAWSFGVLPVAGSIVVIPKGVTVVLDVSPASLGGLIVFGTLMTTADVNIEILLESGFILVQETGAIRIGTSTTPYSSTLTISLAPSNIVDPVYGSSFLAVNGGTMTLSGLATSSVYGPLSQTANPGDMYVSISGITTWSAGSSIVIPTSTDSMSQTEVRRVTSTTINGTNTLFYFATPLLYTHYQGTESNSLALAASYTAVVGLLSRTVKVTSSDVTNRGYVVISTSQNGVQPSVALYYCEFSYLGQRGKDRRHALMFVNVQAPSAIAFTGVSLHRSENRGVFFENSQMITVTSTVVYDTLGHGISSDETASSRFLTFTSVYVASSASAEVFDPKASNFYFTHPTVSVSSCYALGASFAGFAFHLEQYNNATTKCPQDAAFGTFSRNYAQATDIGFTVYPAHAQRTYPCGSGSPIANPTLTTTVTLLQFFRNRRHIDLGEVGSWTIASTWMIDATDVSIAVSAVSSGLVTISTTHVVAHSTLTLNAGSGAFTAYNASVGVRGIKFPDKSGNVLVATAYFAGWATSVLGVPHVAMTVCERCTAPFVTGLPGYRNFVRAVQFIQTGTASYLKFFPPYNSLVLDLDGSFGGTSNSTIAANSTTTTSHLSPLTACTSLDVSAFSTATPTTDALMRCPGTFSLHLVRVTANNSGQPIIVYSTGGATVYPSKPSTFVQGWYESVVVIPSGSVSIDSVAVNVSVFNFTISTGVDNWDRVVVSVPTDMRTMSNQLGLRFNFTVSTYSVDVFARTLAYTAGQLLTPSLSPSDVFTSTIPTYIGALTSSAPTANVTTTFVQPFQVFISVSAAPKSDGVPLIFDLRSSRCSSSTDCISQGTAYAAAASYPWTDVRSWPLTGVIPAAGSVALIPRGVTVTLASATAALQALIIEGTLEFHFRLGGTLTANFVIINGGTLRIGSAAVPFAPMAYINLVRNPLIPPMSVTASITVESGTLLNMGTLQLYGTPKSVPWTSLGALLSAGASSVTTADVLDWNVDEIVAVSSSNYDDTLTEYMQIGQLAADNRGYTSRSPSVLQHDWYTMTINDNTKVTTAAKLAVLNRTIMIRGTGSEPGCQILFVERPTAAFAAAGTLSNVHVDGCGLRNGTKYTSTTGAAVVLRDVQRSSVTISQSSIHNSIGSAVSLENSDSVSITSNAIVLTRGSSLAFDANSNNNIVTGNLIFSTKFSAEILANPATPAALCSFDSRYSLNTFRTNTAGGSASEGFCVQLPACTDTSHANTGNEAHSCVVGHFSTQVDSSITCVSISAFHAWHNAFIGVYSAVSADTYILSSALHDNHIQAIVGRAGSGVNKIQSTVIGGRAGYFDDLACSMTQCVANRIYGTCLERAELLGDGSRSYKQGEIGVLVIPFLTETPGAEYSRAQDALPFFRFGATAMSPAFSSITLDNNIYYYWYRGNDFGRCSGSTVIAVDGFATLRLPTTMISNSSWVTNNDDARVYIPNPVAGWATNKAMCGGQTCDALLHVSITDTDGLFFAKSSAVSAISNYFPATRTCTENIVWNAYMCLTNAVGQLTMRDFPSNTMDSFNLEPLSIREDQQEDIVDLSYLPPLCATPSGLNDACALVDDRQHQFNPLLRLGLRYDADFFVEAPRRLRITLDSCAYSLGRVELRIAYPRSALLTVWVYSGRESDSGYQAAELDQLVLTDSPVGSYYYDSATARLRVLIQCGYTIEIHTVVYATVSMLLQSSVEDFAYETADQFLTNVSDYLVLDPSRVSLVAVFPGSAVAVMQLNGDDNAEYVPATAAAEVNDYVLSLIGYSNAVISQNLGFPVLQTIAAAWANDEPSTVAPSQVNFSLSVGLIVSIAVVSFAIVLMLVILQWRLFVVILNYTDEADEKNEDEELLNEDDDDDEDTKKKTVETLANEKPHISVEMPANPSELPVEDGIVIFDQTEQM